MAIPVLNEYGILPEGVHSCSIQEFYNAFVQNNNQKRIQLYNNFVSYIDKIHAANIPCREIIVDGSYITSKETPSDIDLALVVPYDFIPNPITQEHIDVMFEDVVKKKFGFHMFTVYEESESYCNIVDFFGGMKPPNHNLKKGVLRVII